MELRLSLGEAAVPDAGRAAVPELGLGLGVGIGASAAAGTGRREEGGTGSRAATGTGTRWWAAPATPEPAAVRLSLVSSSLGLQWPPSDAGETRRVLLVSSDFLVCLLGGACRDRLTPCHCSFPAGICHAGRAEAPAARGFDVNRPAPSSSAVAASALLALEDDEDDPGAAAALSSSPNDSAGSFPLDLGGGPHAHHAEGGAAAQAAGGGGERSSSRASDEDDGASARKKLRLSKEQSAFLEESFKEHSTLNPVRRIQSMETCSSILVVRTVRSWS